MASTYTYKYIIDEYGQIVYPRTALSAVDLITANGIQVDHDTISVCFATKEQIRDGSQGQIVSADGLKEAIAAYSDTLYIAGGGIAIEGGTIFAKAAPINSLIKGTPNEHDAVTNANLNGALGVGRAANITPIPANQSAGTVTTYTETSTVDGVTITDDCVKIVRASAPASDFYYCFAGNQEGWSAGKVFLYVGDFKNVGAACYITHRPHSGFTEISGVLSTRTFPANENVWVRLASLRTSAGNGNGGGTFKMVTASTNAEIRIKHYYIFDVTGLSNEAIYALATMEHPELYDKYLVKNDAVCPWMKIHDLGTQTSVSLEAGRAYKLTANDGNTHTIAVNAIPENSYGKETHITILVGATSNVAFKKPLSLMDPLIANAANNCVIRYRDGKAYLYVDDRDYGYVVTIASGGNVDGTMYYGLRTATDNYILISPALDGTPVNLDSATGRAVSVVGNGVNKTILTGNIAPTATTDIHNVTFRNVTVTGGQLVLNSDTKVESGSTVGVSGGSVAIKGSIIEPGAIVRGVITIESVNVYGTIVCGSIISIAGGSISGTGIVNLNSKYLQNATSGTETIIEGGTFTNGTGRTILAYNGGVITISNAVISDNRNATYDMGLYAWNGGKLYATNCLVTRNVGAGDGGACCTYTNNAYMLVTGSTISYNYITGYGIVHAAGQPLDLVDCLIKGNTATTCGGALEIGYANGKINATNCLIVDNVAPVGAGLHIHDVAGTTATLSGCTFGNGQDITLAGSSNLLYLKGYNKFNADISGGSIFAGDNSTIDLSDNSVISSLTINPTIITLGNNIRLITHRGEGRCDKGAFKSIGDDGVLTLSTASSGAITTGRNITVDSGTWTASNVIISIGYAANGGFVLINNNSSVSITGCTISGCTATTSGGAFYINQGTLNITNTLLTGNRSANYGGLICTNGTGHIDISNSTISNNYGQQVMRIYSGSTLNLTNVEITGNTSNNEVGSAFYATGTGVITVIGCYIHNNCDNNAATYSGVSYCSSGGRILFTDTVITGNTARDGSVAGVNGGTQSFVNCTLDGNIYSVSGGGRLVFGGNTKFTGKIHGYTSSLLVYIEPKAVINLRNNENDIPITAQTISAVGNFTVINKHGQSHEYSARTVTGSTITNMGIWLPNPGRQTLSGTVDFIGYTISAITTNGGGSAILSSGTGTKLIKNVTVYSCSNQGQSGENCYGTIQANTSGNTTSVVGCTISDNKSGYGAAVFATNSATMLVEDCVICYNNASGYGGAGQSYNYANLTFINCEMYNNSAGSGGTVMINNGTSLIVKNCYIHDNTGSTPGLFQTGSSVTITGCTFGPNQTSTSSGGTLLISGSNVFMNVTNKTAGVMTIAAGTVIDLRRNTNTNAITGATITAQGTFTVIDNVGTAHTYSAGTKTSSTITNAGAWNGTAV